MVLKAHFHAVQTEERPNKSTLYDPSHVMGFEYLDIAECVNAKATLGGHGEASSQEYLCTTKCSYIFIHSGLIAVKTLISKIPNRN